MNSAATVDNLITQWKKEGHTRAELAVKIAEACLGWPYVWGSLGELDTPEKRQDYYRNKSGMDEKDRENIRKRCQVMNGSSALCGGCKYYPGGTKTRMFDCRGFTRWTLKQVGISLQGAGATSQYNTAANWIQRGPISEMPAGTVCCVFQYNSKENNMQHTGLHICGGNIIHCSGEVKRDTTKNKSWTHYAIPKGIEGDVPVIDKPTLRRGSKGEYVTLLQTMLIQRGYDVGRWGADGSFGAATESAVKLFQEDHGLTADGIVGANTWAALESGETEKWTVTVQHVSRTVAESIVGQYGGIMTKE